MDEDTSTSTDRSIDSFDVPDGVTSVYTPEEMLCEGLKLAGLSEELQSQQPKSNLQDFIDRYGSNPKVLAVIWVDLQSTSHERARVPAGKLNLDYCFMAHHFLKQCPTESERRLAHMKVARRKQTQRDWCWCCVEKIRALKREKIYVPDDHITGDDTWIGTVDGAMMSSWEIADPTGQKAKDPKMHSHKHHSAGFNAEVLVSIKEPRCLWINGPGKAGEDVDLHPLRKEDGLKKKTQEIGKKAMADGGHRGEADLISTPNGHDSAEVRKFKTRASKRHEKFNNVLKNFGCLSNGFRHTADRDAQRWTTCFEAVAAICQCQLENGSPLWNIYVGEM